MKQKYPPIGTCIKFLNGFAADFDLIFNNPEYGLIANCINQETGETIYQIAFRHYEIFCKQIPDIQKRWIAFIAKNNMEYFKEFCNYHNKKAAAIARGDRRFIDHLKDIGYLPTDEEKTID